MQWPSCDSDDDRADAIPSDAIAHLAYVGERSGQLIKILAK